MELKAVILLLGVALLLLFSPAMMDALDNFRLDDQADSYVVGSGVASTTVTLSQALYGGRTANVQSISSNVTDDAPIASSYATATKVLTITGLDNSTGHYLTVTYNIDGLTDFFGGQTAARAFPLLFVMAILAIAGGSVYYAWSNLKG